MGVVVVRGLPGFLGLVLRPMVRSRSVVVAVRGLLGNRCSVDSSFAGIYRREVGLQLGKSCAKCRCNHG